jgi:hypothetical protein
MIDRPGRKRPSNRLTGALRRIAALLTVTLPAVALAFLISCTFDLDYDKYAIVYGVAEYDPVWSPPANLTYTDDDAVDMEALLNQQGFEVSPYTRVDSAATLVNLQADFAAVAANASVDDLFLFYYSGHGGQVASALPGDSEKAPDSDAYEEWIFLYDSYKSTLPAPEYTDLSKTVNDDQLAALLGSIPCVRKIVIIDACNSGGFIGNNLEADAIPPDFSQGSNGFLDILGTTISLYANFQDYGSDITPGDALVIAASGERELSYESGTFQNGVMTHFLLDSADLGDVNNDGYVTVSESYYYIYRNINKDWNPASYAGGYDVFFPHASGGPVDYILFTN